MEEIKRLKKGLEQKDREMGELSEKFSKTVMEKEQLSEKLKQIKEAESWDKMSPKALDQGEPFTPLVRCLADIGDIFRLCLLLHCI